MPSNPRLFQARAHSPRAGEILLYRDIGPAEWGMVDAEMFAKALDELGEVERIDLRIDSAGGSAFTGLAIYNQLVRHPARVDVTVDGVAASIASIIAMAGETVRMGAGARLMIHDAYSIVWGNAEAMTREAQLLDGISRDLAEIYADRTGRPAAQIRDLMRAETWMSAQEAVEGKFADALVDEERVKASLTPEQAARFRHPPKDLLRARLRADIGRDDLHAAEMRRASRENVVNLAARTAAFREE